MPIGPGTSRIRKVALAVSIETAVFVIVQWVLERHIHVDAVLIAAGMFGVIAWAVPRRRD